MKKYDVWLYTIVVEAEGETEACEQVNRMFDDAGLSDKCQADFAEEIL
jgi:hypothetical protein